MAVDGEDATRREERTRNGSCSDARMEVVWDAEGLVRRRWQSL